MKWVLRGYAIVLLAYTGWRTWHFIQTTLPENETGMFLGLVFLFATEVGLLIWHETSLRATTGRQETIAKFMLWVDFAASTAAGLADIFLFQSFVEGYELPRMLSLAILWGLPLVMAMNVGAAILYFNADSDEELGRAKRRLKHNIHKAAIQEVSKQQRAVAKGLAPELTNQLKKDVIQEVRDAILDVDLENYNGNDAAEKKNINPR